MPMHSNIRECGGGAETRLLTSDEKLFLDVFLHEATTSPFSGPATTSLHAIGIEYSDLAYLAWAYEQDVPRVTFEIGHAADDAPPLPWVDRQTALDRNRAIQEVWEQSHGSPDERMRRSEAAMP